MKIVVLSSHTPSLLWFRLDMMRAFLRCGHSVTAVGNEAEALWTDAFAAAGIRYRQVRLSRNGTNPLKDLETLRSLLGILREERPDKIFAYQAKTVIYGSLAAQKLGISEFYPLIAGVGSVFLSDTWKARLVRQILTMEYKAALRRCPHYFFQNADDVALFERCRLIEPQRVCMLPGSGVNLEKFECQPLPDAPCFLFVGRLIRDKGVYEYLEAARAVRRKHPEARFLLVGPFDTNPSALKPEELSAYTDSGDVTYFGEQPDVRPYLARCRIFVLPSYREGTPKAVLEAMACGKAVLTTDAPGCRETVEDGRNGCLVPVRDIGALAAKMCEMIEQPERTARMAAESRTMAEARFDVRLVNQKILDCMKL